MLDFSWSELALIAVVALVVIGPKDLPKALRTVGIWVRRARTISREFQSSIEQMVREAELDEVKKQIDTVSSVDLNAELKRAVDPTGSIEEALKPPEVPEMKSLVDGTEPIEPKPEAAPERPAVETASLPAPGESAQPTATATEATPAAEEPEPSSPAPGSPPGSHETPPSPQQGRPS